MFRRIRGIEAPFPDDGFVWDAEEGPKTVRLLWKEYRIPGVSEAVEQLRLELEAVLVDPDNLRSLRRD